MHDHAQEDVRSIRRFNIINVLKSEALGIQVDPYFLLECVTDP